MAFHEPRLTAATVESPLRSNSHGGFGGRPEETGWSQDQNRASGRPYSRGFAAPAETVTPAVFSSRANALLVLTWFSRVP